MKATREAGKTVTPGRFFVRAPQRDFVRPPSGREVVGPSERPPTFRIAASAAGSGGPATPAVARPGRSVNREQGAKGRHPGEARG